jgi:predicted permease
MTESRRGAARLHALLVRLLPRELRREYESEMLAAFLELLGEARRSGRAAAARLWLREVLDVTATAALARLRPERYALASPLLPRTPRRVEPMNDLWQDFRFALRGVGRERTAALGTVAILAIGIGVNTAAFSVLSAALLKPLPFPDADRLVLVWAHDPESPEEPTTTVSPLAYLEWRERAAAFTDLAAQNLAFPLVDAGDVSERVLAGVVTPNYFDVMGVAPALGRGFRPEDAAPGGGDVVILSHGFWQRRFAGNGSAIGSQLRINGRPRTVVGVLGAGYRHPDPHRPLEEAQFWLPIDFDRSTATTGGFLRVFGRLAPGVDRGAAQVEMSRIAAVLRDSDPLAHAAAEAHVVSMRAWFFDGVRPALLTVMASAAVVLLIVCANVANLVLVRGQRRRREFALRTALGARWPSLLRLLLVEALVLTAPGALLGLLAVRLGWSPLTSAARTFVSNLAVIEPDARVVAFTAGLGVLTALLFGLIPLGSARRAEPGAVLAEESGRGSAAGRATRIRSGLVIGEVALALVLMVCAGLMSRSLSQLASVPPGFETRDGAMVELVLPQERYPDGSPVLGFVSRLEAELRAFPGIGEVGVVDDPPIVGGDNTRRLDLPSDPFPPESLPSVEFRRVTPGYFTALSIPVRGGRAFTEEDAGGVAVVNESAAARFWPGRDPVGEGVVLGADTLVVVGVVADVRDDGSRHPAVPEVNVPFAALPTRAVTLTAAALDSDVDVAGAVRAVVGRLDPNVAIAATRTLDEVVGATLRLERAAAALAAALSVTGALLAGIGIYGVLAYAVSARTREIGIRAALGARAGDLTRLVVGDSMRLALLGVVFGALLAFPATGLLGSLLFGVGRLDPASFLTAAGAVAAVALLATWLPARRAARVSPVEALRDD